MTHPGSGNSPWQDWPSTATLITAARLEAIEAALDALARPTDGGVASYQQSGAQSIGANSVTRLSFITELRTTALVTRAVVGVGHTFTLNRTGLWSVAYGIGVGNAGAGVKRANITQEGTSDVGPVIAPANLSVPNTPVTTFGGGSFVGRLVSGTVLNPYVYTNATGGDTTVAGNSHLVITYLGPA